MSTGIDTRFILASDLEEYFVDKTTGAPLAAGIVTFYSDVSRSTLKPVYQISTTAPYTYTQLANPLYLSSEGTFQDALGNNIVPYYYPYTGTPTQNTGVEELYYITVYSNDGNDNPATLQFTRVAWPNFASPLASDQNNQENFIPNGQFWAHTDITSASIPPVEVVQYGSITVDSQPIAQGGWYFNRKTGGTSTFNNSFAAINTTIPALDDYPRYAFNFCCSVFNASDTVRDLVIKWPNSYTFSANGGTQQYTFQFAAKSNDSNNYTVSVYKVFNYGSGGSPSAQTEILLGTAVIETNYKYFTFHFAFGTPSGTLGTNYDDAVYISIRGPSSTWNIQVTDFSLVFGNVNTIYYPIQTTAEMLSGGVAGWMPKPNPDGSDLYLPLVLTPKGVAFSDADVGKIYASPYTTAKTGELICNGNAYVVADKSPDGIPYRRLFNKLFNSMGSYICPFGNGVDFANAYNFSDANVVLMTNKAGSQTAPANGAVSPTFSYAKAAGVGANNPGAATISLQAWANSNGNILVQCLTIGSVTAPVLAAAGVTGALVIQNNASVRFCYSFSVGNALAFSNGAGLAAQYITISNTTTTYSFWFNVVGEVAAGPGTQIEIQLDSSMSAGAVAAMIANSLNRYQTNLIQCVAAASVPQSSYFTFNTNSLKYVVWYNKAGGGTQPVVASTEKYIEVDLAGTETATQVAEATRTAINSVYYAVPNYQGLFLRGYDPTTIWDNLTTTARYSGQYIFGNVDINSIEFDIFQSHTHTATAVAAVNQGDTTVRAAGNAATIGYGTGSGSGNSSNVTVTNAITGYYETAPVNANVNWVIKY